MHEFRTSNTLSQKVFTTLRIQRIIKEVKNERKKKLFSQIVCHQFHVNCSGKQFNISRSDAVRCGLIRFANDLSCYTHRFVSFRYIWLHFAWSLSFVVCRLSFAGCVQKLVKFQSMENNSNRWRVETGKSMCMSKERLQGMNEIAMKFNRNLKQ